MSRLGNIGGRLYRGEVSVEFVARKRLWYAISGLILVICIGALVFRGLNYSVEFKGGSVFKFSAPAAAPAQVSQAVSTAGGGTDAIVQKVGVGASSSWVVQTAKLTFAAQTKVQHAIASTFHLSANAVSTNFVGPSWGSQISQKALEALIALLIAIVIYLSIAFEWKMASAALIALAHDIVITIGVYTLTGFEVSPATVIGLLTILGYSLYDTVVVFDKVRENTAGLLGAGELKDLALVLFVGMLSGTYSSIFIATPVLADLKEREPQYKALAKRVALRAAGGRAAQRAKAKAAKSASGGTASAAPAAAEEADQGAAPEDGDDQAPPPASERVPAGRPAAGGAAQRGPGARPGPRQQP